MMDNLHSHKFSGATAISERHRHYYRGTTSANPDIPGHTHYMSDITTVNDGHIHRIEIRTSPEIEVRGGHFHKYSGMTTFDDGHVHYFKGHTSIY